MRPRQEHYRASRTVFSIDLPGYRFFERSDRPYTPRLMTVALHAIVAQIHQRCGPTPVDGLALSLDCEFLARAAVERPAAFRCPALVSPTGFRGSRTWRAAPGSIRGLPWLHRLLRGPGDAWGGALFRGLTRPGVVHQRGAEFDTFLAGAG